LMKEFQFAYAGGFGVGLMIWQLRYPANFCVSSMLTYLIALGGLWQALNHFTLWSGWAGVRIERMRHGTRRQALPYQDGWPFFILAPLRTVNHFPLAPDHAILIVLLWGWLNFAVLSQI